jgi:hypothetical protein
VTGKDEARYYRMLGVTVKVGPGKVSDNWSRGTWFVYTLVVIVLLAYFFASIVRW